ncbi:hypothetical protein KORDIASMS9_04483 [Kordia sp. SMS9]|uniref:hypothetical protein n=1 Tax=Kordia sp. SMS9 TaxID=2282170 RepID=UPI000E0D4742|nr:hypothetical protein [Kordia sp. SMS9]AXG72215.1 hypothetical protein KORDIASMS9_04483 [Kordia sp. SMS9]
MKKKQINLKQLALKKSRVASLESDGLKGGFQSWTGTAEPCFPSEFGCGGTFGCPQETDGCPQYTDACVTVGYGCPAPTNGCGFTQIGCQSDSVCPPGVQCY